MKDILKWRSLVNNRLRDIGKAHEREVIELRAQNRTFSVELADLKKAKSKQNQPPSEQQVRIGKPESTKEKMEIGDDWSDNMDEDISIWDLPEK